MSNSDCVADMLSVTVFALHGLVFPVMTHLKE